MSFTDPIGDMLTRIRNAQNSKLVNVILPYSKIKMGILKVLKEEGYINDFKEFCSDNKKNIEIDLKYLRSSRGAISVIERVSKPSRRVYSGIKDLKEYYNGMGIYIISTSTNGVVSSKFAKSKNISGEIICKVF